MSSALLVTTSSEGLQPLGSAAQRSFELISNTVRDQLGPEHAALFGEPVATEHGDRIDWYAPMAGKPVPLPELDAAEQQQLRDTLGQRIADIKARADQLGDSAAASDQRLSEALSNAIEVPDQAMIYGVRDADGALHPVLVHWAWVRDEHSAVRGILTGMVPRPKPPQPAPVVPVVRSSFISRLPSGLWWALIVLGWLLLATLLGMILYLLVAPCGLNRGRLVFCPTDAPELHAALGEAQVTEDRIIRLQHELALADRECQPSIPIAPFIPLPEAPSTPAAPTDDQDQTKTEADRADVDRRIADRGAARGELNFALEWASTDDVDLYVTCPTGETISYRNRNACGGRYDLDANVAPSTAIGDPVENIVFTEVTPGLYKVRAHLRGDRTGGEKTVTLHVLRKDGPSQSYTGTLGPTLREWVTNISISR